MQTDSDMFDTFRASAARRTKWTKPCSLDTFEWKQNSSFIVLPLLKTLRQCTGNYWSRWQWESINETLKTHLERYLLQVFNSRVYKGLFLQQYFAKQTLWMIIYIYDSESSTASGLHILQLLWWAYYKIHIKYRPKYIDSYNDCAYV